jgi:hypothetical protein
MDFVVHCLGSCCSLHGDIILDAWIDGDDALGCYVMILGIFMSLDQLAYGTNSLLHGSSPCILYEGLIIALA